MDRATDEELLLALKSNKPNAGARLFDRHYEALSRFFRNKVDDSHRDDIVQQTFMSLPQAAFDGRSTIKTGVFAIAWRRLCDHYCSQARGNKHEAALADLSVLEFGSTSVPTTTTSTSASGVRRTARAVKTGGRGAPALRLGSVGHIQVRIRRARDAQEHLGHPVGHVYADHRRR